MTRTSTLLGMDLDEELAAIRAHKTGRRVLKTKKRPLPANAQTIRHRLGLTQEAFAGLMGVSVQTLRNWEQGTRQPQGPSLALLSIIEKNPEVLFT